MYENMTAEQIQSQIDRLKTLQKQVKLQPKLDAIKMIKNIMSEYGVKIADLRDPEARKISAMYVCGDKTWSGRGKKTKWIEEIESNGGDIEQYRVRPSAATVSSEQAAA